MKEKLSKICSTIDDLLFKLELNCPFLPIILSGLAILISIIGIVGKLK